MKRLIAVLLGVLLIAGVSYAVEIRDDNTVEGHVARLNLQRTDVTVSGDEANIDLGSISQDTSSSPIFDVVGTTGAATSISTFTTTTGTKAAAIMINYTGLSGSQETGWIRVYDSAQ